MTKKYSTRAPKRTKINTTDKPELLDFPADKKNPYRINIPRAKKFSSKDILRLHSNLIRSFIEGSIDSNEAKTLSYLCSNYLNAWQAIELESRLSELENRSQS